MVNVGDCAVVRNCQWLKLRIHRWSAAVPSIQVIFTCSAPHTCCMPCFADGVAAADAALGAAAAYLNKLTPEQLKNVLRYHVIPGEYTLPADFTPGQLYQTGLKGHTVTLKYTQ